VNADDDGYTHQPGTVRDTDDDRDTDRGARDDEDGDLQGAHPDSAERSVGRRGWVLLAVLAFSLLGAPLLILWRPPGIPYWAALLALPMLPAILLGAVGVWATTRP
jgi:hypothetical protein